MRAGGFYAELVGHQSLESTNVKRASSAVA
jgi:hypothetical protein